MAGFRKPSVKKSLSASYKGKYTRAIKRATNPLYGKKGTGMMTNPQRSIHNKIYNKTTVGLHRKSSTTQIDNNDTEIEDGDKSIIKGLLGICIAVIWAIFCINKMGWFFGGIVGGFIGVLPLCYGISKL